ncbi:ThiF family adenylyltransferase [Bariatricus massiliensis]|uniref:ThiF family adenylyltransferase n=1 Tax=Bariatricus massiliensis TaxID=1745713 RepID=A0ABS8DC10_9FIRM|nr:ThiF family adenylyltransferase [Bariatricus massiliensis]MCB7303850.1 ThiF family adenylyltransferase [Bariatricus massiliensis]MCB7373266.1 ThiF family adenylyltransferase [Bariatricus massiliensis]MCB7385936.1 ThiF family adenylyltransferase [Bariatricus massiliensis]MCB7410098.1 ThiF family adenylyltransferase [Bariatricus massiliensis]MCQ5252934.1 ThiF family adenylyltransferase [Bariatricus massiliensis]
MLNGKVISLRIFEKKGSTGRRMPAIRFADHAGIIGDVHYGEREMQVSIMTRATENWMQDKKGLCFRRFKANIVLDGIEEECLEEGNFIKIGDSVLEITGYEQRCFSECERFVKHMECRLMKGCCYAKVVKDGKIRRGDMAEVIEAREQADSEERRMLREASALIIGAGSIGCSAARTLAESGVGAIGIVDSGIVTDTDVTGIGLFQQEDIGKNKAECLSARLMSEYTNCYAEPWIESITEDNGERLIPGYGIVLLTANMSETKEVVRKIAYRHQVPLVDDKKVAELIGAAEAQYAVECLCAQTEGETEGEAAPA